MVNSLNASDRRHRLEELKMEMLNTAAGKKHFRVCHALLQGADQADAWMSVYKSKSKEAAKAACSRMLTDVNSGASEYIEHMEWFATANAEEKLNLDTLYVLEKLKTIVEECMKPKPVIGRCGDQLKIENTRGELVPQYTFQASGAIRALELIGKHLGMFKEKVLIETEDPLTKWIRDIGERNANRSLLPSGK